MSAFNRAALNTFAYVQRNEPTILDQTFAFLLQQHKLEETSATYLTNLEITKGLNLSYISTILVQGRITQPMDFYEAIGIKLSSENNWHGLSSITYFSRVRRELLAIAKASGMEDLAIVMFMGRIDRFILSKEPGYVPIRSRG